MGLLDMPGFAPGALYGQGLLTPEQQQAIAARGLLGAAGSFAQAAMPSRMPVPIGAVLGSGAAGMGQAEDQAGQQALQGGLLGMQLQQAKWKMDMANKLPGLIAQMYGGGTAGQGGPAYGGPSTVGAGNTGTPVAAPGTGSSTGGLLTPAQPPVGGGLLTGGMPAPGASTPTPKVDDILPVIGQYESGGKPYVGYGGTDLSNAPLDSTGFPIWEGKQGPDGQSHAAGIYQIEPDTWKPIAQKLGIHDFSPASQAAVARELYLQRGLDPWKSNTRLMSAIGGGGGAGSSVGAPSQPVNTVAPGYGSNFNMGNAAGVAALGDFIGVPSLGQLIMNSPQWQGQVESAKQWAGVGPKIFVDQNQIRVVRPGGMVENPITHTRTYAPTQVQIANPDGSKQFGYMTPDGGVQLTGQSSEISPATRSQQERSGTNVADLGPGYGGPSPGTTPPPPNYASPAAPTAPAGQYTGNTQGGGNMMAGGATPGMSGYVPPASNGAPATKTPAMVDLSKVPPPPSGGNYDALNSPIRVNPGQSTRGTVIPPLSQQSMPPTPTDRRDAAKRWGEQITDWTDGIDPSRTAEMRFTTMARVLQSVQSGTFQEQRASLAAALRGVGLGDLADKLTGLNPGDVAGIQTLIHENQLTTLDTLKAASGRFTQKEFGTIGENTINPNLQPEANLQILSENIARLRQDQQLPQDWNDAQRMGWQNPEAFEAVWTQMNPLTREADRVRSQFGPLKGMPGNGAPAASSATNQSSATGRPTVAPEGQVMQGSGGHLIIKQNGGWVDAVTKQPLGFGKIPSR